MTGKDKGAFWWSGVTVLCKSGRRGTCEIIVSCVEGKRPTRYRSVLRLCFSVRCLPQLMVKYAAFFAECLNKVVPVWSWMWTAWPL